MKKVIVVHGWEGNSESHWFPWLKKKLKSRGFEVIIPDMPNTEEPEIDAWVSKLKEVSGKVNRKTFLVGHSIGCQAILRYLETLDSNLKVGGVVFVAPWMQLDEQAIKEEGEEVFEIARPWIETPIEWEKVKKHSDNFICVFSDNDPHILLSNVRIFEKNLDAEVIIENSKGHFDSESGVSELPIVLKKIKDLMKG